jgi:hypothetical protein
MRKCIGWCEINLIRFLVSNDLESVWKEIVADLFCVLSSQLLGSLHENYTKPQSRQSVSWLNFETATS